MNYNKILKRTVWLEIVLRYWQTRTHCCGHIVAHDVSLAAQSGKHLLRTQNVSEQNQKHVLCPVARFSKAPETFRARKAILRSSVSKNGEVYTPETFCMK